MYHPEHPDGDYEVANEVQVLERPYVVSGSRDTTSATARSPSAGGCGVTR